MAHNMTQQAFFTLKMPYGSSYAHKVRPSLSRFSPNFPTVILCSSRVPNVVHISRGVQITEAAAIHDRKSSTTANGKIFMTLTMLRHIIWKYSVWIFTKIVQEM